VFLRWSIPVVLWIVYIFHSIQSYKTELIFLNVFRQQFSAWHKPLLSFFFKELLRSMSFFKTYVRVVPHYICTWVGGYTDCKNMHVMNNNNLIKGRVRWLVVEKFTCKNASGWSTLS
jgi:hypothetical protein